MTTEWDKDNENAKRQARNDCRQSIRNQIHALNLMLVNTTWLGISNADELFITDETLLAHIGEDEAEVE
jgi:hypothetical protein